MSETPLETKHPIDFDKAAEQMAEIRQTQTAAGNLVYSDDGSFSHALAPNGEHSRLSEQHWLFVRTGEFQGWFGDWQNNPEEASKIIDSNGEPLLVWHESPADKDFNYFDDDQIGSTNDGGYYGRGHYFFNNRNVAVSGFYAGDDLIDYACFLNVRKLFREDRPELYELTGILFGNPDREDAIERGFANISAYNLGWDHDNVVDFYDEIDATDGRFNGHQMHDNKGPIDEGVDEIVVKRGDNVMIVDKYYSATGQHLTLPCLTA